MSLVARHLEAAGIPTVVVGSALDIVVEVAAPRFVFVDFPLGNPCGPPDDPETQRAIVELALQTADQAFAPMTVVRAPIRWPTQEWRDRYMHVGPDNIEELARLGEERRAAQAAKRSG